jgi:hypothetical protein
MVALSFVCLMRKATRVAGTTHAKARHNFAASEIVTRIPETGRNAGYTEGGRPMKHGESRRWVEYAAHAAK